MRLKDEETKQERIDRLTTIDRERNKFIARALPILIIILIIMVAMLIVINKKEAEKNLGNPYECADCKELARACKNHKDFNHDNELKETINNSLYYYKYSEGPEDNYKYYLYGESYYNLDCDFCNEIKEECEGCKYTRQAVLNYTNKVLTDDIKDRFCDNCKELGYAYCSSDMTFIAEKVFNEIKH